MTQEGAFEFPCAFPVKVLGRNDQAFRDQTWAIMTLRCPDLQSDHVTENVSRNGKFVSMTFTVEARDQDGLDDLYRALTENPQVLMAL